MLDSYNEIAESYAWGFAALGHHVRRQMNGFDPDALNIVFGFMIPVQLGLIDTFPANTIFVNLERYAYSGKSLIHSSLHYVASKYQIWDYSLGNVAAINTLNPKYPPYHARISYAPYLEKVPKGAEQDIDVLYYGKFYPARFETLNKIAASRPDFSGLSVMSLTNVWGKQRDEFISRAKVVVNMSYGGDIFEIVRVSYLLANGKAVVCAYSGEPEIEDDLRNGVLKFVQMEEVQATCQALVDDDAVREQYARHGYEVFRQRDVREVIVRFFN